MIKEHTNCKERSNETKEVTKITRLDSNQTTMNAFSYEDVRWDEKVGSGNYSNVFAYGQSGMKVVKTCKCSRGKVCKCEEGRNLRREFKNHKATLSVLKEHTVELFAISPESVGRTFIVMSRMPVRSTESIKALSNMHLYGLNLEHALKLISSICEKLNEVNAKTGIYHGDTPSNIFLIKKNKSWTWMVIDFGFSVNRKKEDDTRDHPFYDHGLRAPDSTMWLYAVNFFAIRSASQGNVLSLSIVNILKPIIIATTKVLRRVPVQRWVPGAPCTLRRGGKRWKVTFDSLKTTDDGFLCNVMNDAGSIVCVSPKHLTIDCVQYYENNTVRAGKEHALQFLGAAEFPTPSFECAIEIKQKRKLKRTASNQKRRKISIY